MICVIDFLECAGIDSFARPWNRGRRKGARHIHAGEAGIGKV